MSIFLPDGTVVESREIEGAQRQVLAVGEPLRPLPDLFSPGRVVWADDPYAKLPPIWNDGRGGIRRDFDILAPGGIPSIRLSTHGVSAGTTPNPGRTANISGVVAKMRIHNSFSGVWGICCLFRLTSLNNTSNAMLTLSLYNRTGVDTVQTPPLPSQQARHFRLWLDPNGNNQSMVGRILDGAATAAANAGNPTSPSAPAVYTDVVTSWNQNGGGSHTYDPATGRLDRVGGWHQAELWVNFSTGDYVRVRLDSWVVDFEPGQYVWDVTDSSGMAGFHHSVEYHGNTTTPRFVNIAALRVMVGD